MIRPEAGSDRSRVGVAGVAIVLAMLASCTIKDIDLTGKACPCADGWICGADNTCKRATNPTDDAMQNRIDAPIDAGVPLSSCLTSPFATVKYSTDFSDFSTAWKASGGAWATAPNGLAQTDKAADLAYAWHSTASVPLNYRAVATMRQTSGDAGGALEIAFRFNDATVSMYHCNYEPNDGKFMIQHTDSGIAGSTLQQVQVASLGLAAVTMEVQVSGNTLECCLDNVVGAHITLTNSLYTMGYAGLKTYRMAGVFGSFVLLQ